MGNIKVSIILPCYNVASYIDSAVEAILGQTYCNYEVIFINDGSTDDTLEVIKRQCCRENFYVYDFPNQGVAQARNEGIRLSQGEYLYFMDPDDVIMPDLLEVALGECERCHADAVQFHYRCEEAEFNGNKGNAVFEKRQILDELIPRFIGYSGERLKMFGTSEFYDSNEWAAVWRFLFKTSVIKDNQVQFPRGVKMSEDRFFILNFLCYAGKVVTIDKKLYRYVIRDTGCMLQGLVNPQALLKNKMDGVLERRKVRDLLLRRKGVDIFDLYSGSLVLSCLELYVKLSATSFGKGWKAVCKYSELEDVKQAIRASLVLAPPKMLIPMLLVRMHLGILLYAVLWVVKKCATRWL